jgi:hypothetical protein
MALKLERNDPPALSDRAIDNLRFIRETMEKAGTFTAISGRGISATGVVALVAYAVSGSEIDSPRWLTTWIVSATVAFAISIVMTWRKAGASTSPVTAALARKLALAFFPSLVAGAVITAVALRAEWFVALPGFWLLMYGAAVMAGGALSAPIVPVMGLSFMTLGAAALALPVILSNAWSPAERAQLLNGLMALGFGGLHLLYGAAISRRYGG